MTSSPYKRAERFIWFPIAILTAGIIGAWGIWAAADEKNHDDGPSKVVVIPKGDIVSSDYFAAADVVEISGTVRGDAYVAARQILIDGIIEGDLLAAGGHLIISGSVEQDARVAGGQVTITGTIARNLTLAGGNVSLAHSGSVGGGMVVAAGNVVLAAPVAKDVKLGAGNVTVSSRIGGNLTVATGDLHMTSNAAVGGNVIYWSDRTAFIDEGAEIGGSIVHRVPPQISRPSAGAILAAFAGVLFFMKVVSFISTLILGLLFIRFFPNYHQASRSMLKDRPWASLGIGFGTFVLAPVLGLILLATLVGLPLGIILLALYLIALYLARVLVISWLGSAVAALLGRTMREGWAFFLGLVIYFGLTFVPLIGGLVSVFVQLFGLGSAVLTQREYYRGVPQARNI